VFLNLVFILPLSCFTYYYLYYNQIISIFYYKPIPITSLKLLKLTRTPTYKTLGRVTLLLSRDTPVTSYARLPISTNSAIRDRPRDGNLTAIWWQSTATCRILSGLLNPTKFCRDRYPNPILPRILLTK
jgi:hypothetical protein